MAKQTRYSPWCPATVSKRHVYNGRLTLTVDWEGASEGPFTRRVSPPRASNSPRDRGPSTPDHPPLLHTQRGSTHHRKNKAAPAPWNAP